MINSINRIDFLSSIKLGNKVLADEMVNKEAKSFKIITKIQKKECLKKNYDEVMNGYQNNENITKNELKEKNMLFFLKNTETQEIDEKFKQIHKIDGEIDPELYNVIVKHTIYCHYKKEIQKHVNNNAHRLEKKFTIEFKGINKIKSTIILDLFKFLTKEEATTEKNIKKLKRMKKIRQANHLLKHLTSILFLLSLIMGFSKIAIIVVILSITFFIPSIQSMFNIEAFFIQNLYINQTAINYFLQFFDENLNNSFLDKIKNQHKEMIELKNYTSTRLSLSQIKVFFLRLLFLFLALIFYSVTY